MNGRSTDSRNYCDVVDMCGLRLITLFGYLFYAKFDFEFFLQLIKKS